jgi:hypothetical protein
MPTRTGALEEAVFSSEITIFMQQFVAAINGVGDG